MPLLTNKSICWCMPSNDMLDNVSDEFRMSSFLFIHSNIDLLRKLALFLVMSLLTSAATSSATAATRRRFISTFKIGTASMTGSRVSSMTMTGMASHMSGRHPIQVMYDALSEITTSSYPSMTLKNALENPLRDENLSVCLDAMNQIQLSDLGQSITVK